MTVSDESLRETWVFVREESDVAIARKLAREISARIGLTESAVESVATAVSEIARNIVVHAWSGEIRLRPVAEDGRVGILVVGVDNGPGIPDVAKAMEDGYSTGSGLGFGLAGAHRLMDEFHLESAVGHGTKITMKKWAGSLTGLYATRPTSP